MLAICGGLMRTGSVAMFQIMREIVDVNYIGYSPVMPVNDEDEFFHEYVGEWASGDGVVVTKLHRWREDIEPHKNGVKVVMTIRDMRDVVVSLMNFRSGTFESSLHSNAFKGNIEGQAEWEKKVPPENLLLIKYEYFIRNRIETTKRVAEFLGVKITPVQALEIERKWNINANLRRAKAGYSERSPEYMSKRHIQSGKEGQWKTALTLEQTLEVQHHVGHSWFTDNGYKLLLNEEPQMVLIMAGGQAERWTGPLEKQLVDIGGKPLITRTVEQVRRICGVEPYIIAASPDIIAQSTITRPASLMPGKTITESLHHTINIWKGRVIVLHGDVYFTDETMYKIASGTRPAVFFGRLLEIYALSFNNYVLMVEAIEPVEKSDCNGKLWHLWYSLNDYSLDTHTMPAIDNEYFCQLNERDNTMDIDEWDDYVKLAEKIGFEI